MTIIEPNKNKFHFSPLLTILIIGLIVGVLSNIYLYNKNVDSAYLLNKQEKHLQELEVINADNKNQLYKILDDRNFNEVVAELGLVKDNRPEYLKSHVAALAALFN
ncbi:MAG: hypothetical protein Q8Q37_00765 [bacterium]|nr:hypothetical protein [bacterium]